MVHSLDAALEAAAGSDEVFICGGEEIFREALSLAHRIYLTIVHGKQEGDTLFPEIPPILWKRSAGRSGIRSPANLPCMNGDDSPGSATGKTISTKGVAT